MLLVVLSHRDAGAALHDSGIRRFLPQHDPQQCRLAAAVGADEADAVAADEVEGGAGEHHVVAVCLVHVFQKGDLAPALAGVGEPELGFLRFDGLLRPVALLQHAPAATRGDDVVVAGHRFLPLDPRHLLLQIALLHLVAMQRRFPLRLLLLPVGGVVAAIRLELPAFQLPDLGADRVQEVPVVRGDHGRAGVLRQVVLQPLGRVDVQVVRRLVQQQHVRLLKQHLH